LLGLVTAYDLVTGPRQDEVNLLSEISNDLYNFQVGTGDTVMIGSRGSQLGGTLATIHGSVRIQAGGESPNVVVDDSGDAVSQHPTFQNLLFGTDGDGNPIYLPGVSGQGLPTIYFELCAAASATFLGGSGNDIFTVMNQTGAPALTLDGGSGINTLDYSEYSGTSGLVAWYPADGSANSATGGPAGTAVGEVAYATGVVGQAFNFNRTDAFVDIPNDYQFQPATVSVEAWVNSTDSTQQYGYIVSKGANGSLAASYALYTGPDGGLEFYVSNGQTYVASPDAGSGIWDGNWHHVVGTYDGSVVRLYVDGQEVGNGTPTNIQIAYGLPTHNDLVIGAFNGPSLYPFSGLVDEPSIYNRALSPTEIEGLFTSGKSAVVRGVVVNLQTGAATGLVGITHIQSVVGTVGNDTLVAGDDRGVLIGEGGSDSLIGGSSDDILIAGTTDYTRPGNLNVAALQAIMAEWNRTDLGFSDRVSDLLTGSNSVGATPLNVVDGTSVLVNQNTVHGDLSPDALTGGLGRNWYFVDLDDVVTNFNSDADIKTIVN
jgi:Ca2+-binding RTX toxin-like protein